MIGGNLDQDDLDAVGVLDPHLDQSPGLRRGLPDDRDAGCGQPAVLGADTRTWIQIITERPGGPAACAETSSNPGPRKKTTPGLPGGPNSR